VVQPSNARTNIGGVADGSFDVTLGYEAVALFYQGKGAKVGFGLPILNGEKVTTPVLFAVGLVENRTHEGARRLADYLLDDEVQGQLGKHFLRSVRPGMPGPPGGLDLAGVRVVDIDWSDWRRIEERLADYEVRR
ncbi:MAG TPA: hypothetical protein VHI93_03695, partial [Candidatus Thermoplasmatota archaeon]|nr:hypothetical protein [Candidatus Thermoplasmatota archaeon]